MECPTKTLTFKVIRKTPELITPAKPTPHEFKPLSDLDDSDMLRIVAPYIAIYEGIPSMQGKDPVDTIRHAIAKALVFYYPLAGRLREIATRKLVVECTAEGVLFIEADADATVQDFIGLLHPPFPNLDQLLYNVPGSDGITDCPLLLFQVTRLKCGGFIFAMRFNHTVGDGVGMLQFLYAIAELARGGEVLTVKPIWERHLLSARNPPCVSFLHPVFDDIVLDTKGDSLMEFKNMTERSFLFSAEDIAALGRSVAPHYQKFSQTDLLMACVWRCRTIALATNHKAEYRLIAVVNIRNRMVNPRIPVGYYGNALVATSAAATVEELSMNPLHYTIELVKKAKSEVTDEYVKSFVDVVVIKERRSFVIDQSFIVSELGSFSLNEVEFGWGNAAYGGMAKAGPDSVPGLISWFMPFKDSKGKNGAMVPICLPANAMEIFRKELKLMMEDARKRSTSISNASAL